MALPYQIKFIGQSEMGDIVREGVLQSDRYVLNVDSSQGLIALGEGEVMRSELVMKSVEILQDDMKTNLATMEDQTGAASVASICLSESLANINEYLASKLSIEDQGVALAALQLMPDYFSVTCLGPLQCFAVHAGGFRHLPFAEAASARLGRTASIDVPPLRQSVTGGELVCITTAQDIASVGLDFMRLTLTRFTDNPDMILRQLNTRFNHEGIDRRPVLLLVSIGEPARSGRGWFARLRNR